MKKCIATIIVVFCSFFVVNLLYATPNTWTRKTDFGGSGRVVPVGFSIGSKGYVGTGNAGTPSWYVRDFWQYDPATNTWTRKADFGGEGRYYAAAFSIGNKGYIGTGYGDSGSLNDFWEYDPATDTWTRKADFPGSARDSAVGFSIGDKGYIGMGVNGFDIYQDFWEYDPATDTWTQKADFPGSGRQWPAAFSIGDRGYIGTGWDGTFAKDFWEYDPATDTWTRKADFGGTARNEAIGFSIGSKGYIGTGQDDLSFKKDFWEYDPATDTWTRKADFGGAAVMQAVGLSIGSKGYIGTGWDDTLRRDFWEYEPGGPFSFTDVPLDYWAYAHIVAIYNAGYTTGYAPGIFAPELSVTREQMAAFIIRAVEGEPATDYCSTGSPFPDCTTESWSCRYIKRLYDLGLTTGYGTTGLFMPAYNVSREQMAAFLVRTKEGEPAADYCASGSPFSDVTAANWSCIYIKRLYELSITTGYGNGLYGPYDLVTRAQMAVFLGRAFLGME